MYDHERYRFDLNGFITIPDALNAGQLEALNHILDEHIASDCDENIQTHRFGNLLDWGKPFRDLIDNAAVVPYLSEIIDPEFRLDHVYADVIRSGLSPIGANLHGGAAPFNPSQYFRFAQGRMHNGLTVVAYNLADVGPEDGGFGCVPGSHKSNYPFPSDWKQMDAGLIPEIRRVTGPAGTAIVFTEALTHGALPWTGAHERRTVFYKYSPHPVSWAPSYFDESIHSDLTDRQRDILEPPSARPGGPGWRRGK